MVAPSSFCPSASHLQCIFLGLLVPQAQAGLELGVDLKELAMGLRAVSSEECGCHLWGFCSLLDTDQRIIMVHS